MSACANRRAVFAGLARLALMPVAALLVHQLRFQLAFGGRAGLELARQGHSYLHSLTPWIVILISVTVGGFVWALGRALAGQRSLSRYTVSFLGLWIFCAACLVAIYVTQESLEGLFAVGHPGGLAGVFGYGGWWAVPAALCVGLVLAAICHGARWVLDEVAHRRSGPLAARVIPSSLSSCPGVAFLPRLSPLAGGWSGRGPPS
jgi:hypothetical protein